MSELGLREERAVYLTEAAGIMGAIAALAAHPEPDAETFAGIERLAGKGGGLDPVAQARGGVRVEGLLCPLFAVCAALWCAPLTTHWTDFGGMRWVFVGLALCFGSAAFVSGRRGIRCRRRLREYNASTPACDGEGVAA